ncbi:DUF1682 domain-containing protein [Aquabacterium sp. A7-Y]|uniref:DUF6279 family lipoprotein n=1 Tax=Aquabacterium sp. A7-Y TaxID=1349605 RepID=UPI00223DAF57|nr:DUF6279 family lipoprotein [Aquabacterium sp. A7-Y]MCW7541994.1 DUF1682 domain-containing protein [Aquabacterium sp. A7-Y]
MDPAIIDGRRRGSLPLVMGLLLSVVLMAGCSTMRLAYNQGQHMAYWWLDNYIDVTDEQSPQARDEISRWFRWHRATQLPAYAQSLAQLRQEVLHDGTPAQACRWWGEVTRWRDLAAEHALPAMADLALKLTPEQIEHLQNRYQKSNREFRKDHLQEDHEERQQARLKRSTERAESLYGRLSPEQRQWLAQRMAASPFDAEVSLRERQRRQQDVLQTLRALQAERPAVEQARARVRELVHRLMNSPDAHYRSYHDKLTAFNCELVAQLHNRTTADQRQTAQDKLHGWEKDLRALAAAAES